MPNILPNSSVVYTSVLTHGITQLGLRSHPAWSPTPEAITTTLPFFRSDQPVYTTSLLRPTHGWGAHMVDSQILGTWTWSDCRLHINCLELKAVILALHLRVTVLLILGHQVMIYSFKLGTKPSTKSFRN